MRLLLVTSMQVVFPGRRVDLLLDSADASDAALAAAARAPEASFFVTLLKPRTVTQECFELGTIARVLEMERARAVVEGVERARSLSVDGEFGSRIANLEPLPDPEPDHAEIGERMRTVRELFSRWAERNGRMDSMSVYLRSLEVPSRVVYAIASFGPFAELDRQKILETLDVSRQLELLEAKLD